MTRSTAELELELGQEAVKRSVNPSTAGSKRPLGETGELRKAALSATLISIKFSHMWRSNTTELATALISRLITESDQSSVSEAASDMLPSEGSSSDPPNETRGITGGSHKDRRSAWKSLSVEKVRHTGPVLESAHLHPNAHSSGFAVSPRFLGGREQEHTKDGAAF